MRHGYAVAVVSDLHIGSTVALSPATYNLPDGQILQASKSQLWINQCWNKFWSEFHKLQAKTKIIVVNGEFCEGEHHANHQLSGQAEVMEAMAVDLMLPHVNKVSKLFVVRGSSAHSKSQGMADEMVARQLGAKTGSQVGWKSDYRWIINVGGVIMDFAHHVTGSGVPWTAGNNVRRMVLETVLNCNENNRSAPDLIIRSHVHKPAMFQYGKTRGYITPSWKLQDEYGFKIAPSSILPIGGLIITVDHGQAEVFTKTYRPEENSIYKV